jgi:2-succinyl-5-enolpyruvyl-6-hydroxy-3-cyclohexene-1-carboxylate synthase
MAVTTTATFCATLVDEWVRAGLTDAVVCPGSRSTPMALALAADDRVQVHVHHDERAAAFLALGLGLASGQPAIVLTTSGTAAVELHPAVVEAHHAKVPMLVVTADRPPELRDVGAPQTIDQQHLFGAAVRWFVDPGAPVEEMREQWRSLASRAITTTVASPPGPVHLNLPFRDPLVGAPGPLPPGRHRDGAWHGVATRLPDAAEVDVAALADACAGRRGIIVAGGGIRDAEAVHALAAALRWPVLADPRSGCRLPRPATISHFDAILRVPEVASLLAPDIVLRLGALPASKVLGQWLAGLDAWQIGLEADGTVYDPDRTLNALLAVDPGVACERLALELREGPESVDRYAVEGDGLTAPDGWLEGWAHLDAEAAAVLQTTVVAYPGITEPGVARDVVAALPEGASLVVSSSMPVRDVEWYSAPREHLEVLANRGANGIDGVVSTAVGVALANRRSGTCTAVLIGDVAFLHDTNALLGVTSRGIDLVIVVVDNDGGGIFSFLPQAAALDTDRFEQLFGTPHGVDLETLAAAHRITAIPVDQPHDVRTTIEKAAVAGGVQLVIVRTDRAANVDVHDELHAAIADAVSR